ncbi:MAG: FkbM family methyltransferase [Prosthecobacter sp.]
MNFCFFLYRRLCRFVTCVLRTGTGSIVLRTKYDVASFQDVFCGPYYWQVYTLLGEEPPLTIVDAGANVGHFSILVSCCLETKYEKTNLARFHLIEPNAQARRLLEKNLRDAGMLGRCVIHAGALGEKAGVAQLRIDPKNFLTSSVVTSEEATGSSSSVVYLDLNELVPGPIDILKIDIEGSEHAFLIANPEVLSRTQHLMLELHETTPAKREQMLMAIANSGLSSVGPPIHLNGQELFVFSRLFAK